MSTLWQVNRAYSVRLDLQMQQSDNFNTKIFQYSLNYVFSFCIISKLINTSIKVQKHSRKATSTSAHRSAFWFNSGGLYIDVYHKFKISTNHVYPKWKQEVKDLWLIWAIYLSISCAKAHDRVCSWKGAGPLTGEDPSCDSNEHFDGSSDESLKGAGNEPHWGVLKWAPWWVL